MRVIYEPKGQAREFSPLAANLYDGCGHSCLYCYAPLIMRKNRIRFQIPELRRPSLLRELELDAREIQGDRRPILLCFSCDPYQPIDEGFELARRAIEILHRHDLTVQILTKGGKRSERDFDLLAARPERSHYAATLVFADEDERRHYEPHAAPTQERIECLKRAHELGIPTWVALEPVYYPEDAYRLIRETHEFVDEYRIGKLNYYPAAEKVDWHIFTRKVIELLERLGNRYYIKKSLRKYMKTEREA